DDGRTRRRNCRCHSKSQPLSNPTAPCQRSAVAYLGQSNELTACNMYEARNAQQTGRRNRNEAARPGPYCVDEIELGRTVHGANGTNCSYACEAETDVVDMRPGQLPVAWLSLLAEGEDLHVMTTRQATDQRHQRGNYPIFSRPVYTSRY